MATRKAVVYVIYYSTYGHIGKMAQSVVAGAKSTGADVKLFQIKETLSDDIKAKMHAPPQDASIPFITAEQLPAADALIFGIPTRYGSAPAQFKTFWDSTGGLWAKGSLVGKIASIFFSTGTQGGGQETTALTSLPNFVHHGMIYVPTGYTHPSSQFQLNEICGGSAYGAGTFAGGDGSRQPSKLELDFATHQGSYVASVANKLVAGTPQA